MKRRIIGLLAFVLTLCLGIFLAWLFIFSPLPTEPAPIKSETGKDIDSNPATVKPISTDSINPKTDNKFEPEFTNVSIPDDDLKAPWIRLQMVFNGDAWIGECEAPKKSMTSWLGIFKNGNDYSLERRKISFGLLMHDDFGPYYHLKFKDSEKALFIFTDIGELKPGEVKTIDLNRKTDINDFSIGFRRDVNISIHKYTLRVAPGTTESGQQVSVLIVESENKSQIVYYKWFDKEVSPDLGDLEWIGDLDGDGHLDFILSYFDQNGGGRSYILFVSSKARKDELVWPYAFYHTRFRGC